ncbi:MAG TPA: hypothetical protein VNV17_11520, partial [Solirubrobacteraceae bacterium]|nr:hypothetical protein [Solirubrobacteraceae bacterium]
MTTAPILIAGSGVIVDHFATEPSLVPDTAVSSSPSPPFAQSSVVPIPSPALVWVKIDAELPSQLLTVY